MNSKLVVLMGAVAIVAGTVGGVVGAWIASPEPAFAAAGRRTSGVETNELRLVDLDGNVRALMGLDSTGNPRLSFFDESGIIRVWTGVTPEGIAMVNLRDAEGNSRMFVQVDEKSPLFSMRDSNDVGRIYLQVSADEPLFNLRDKADKGGVFVKVAEDGPVLWFADEEGNTTYQQR